MPAAPRFRSARVVVSSVAAAALAAAAGLACNQTKPPPAAQAVEAQRQQQPLTKLPSNAPINAPAPTVAPLSPTVAAGLAGPVAPSAVPAPPAAEPQGSRAAAPPPPSPVAPAPAPAPVASDIPNIPADAEWTIYAFAVKGAAHVDGAKQARAGLATKTGRSDWYVIHGTDESNIYFGFYKTVDPNNPAEGRRAHDDLKMVKEVRDLHGRQPFAQSAFVSLSSPDPSAPAEWALFNVDRALHPKDPRRAYWSLQVMAFRADPRRKEAAVEAVRDLRAGGVDAYYHHGQDVSSVCVGRWPVDAVKAQNRTDDRPDVAHATADSNLVVSAVPLETLKPDGGLKAKPVDGRQAATVAPKLEVLDPSLRQMMDKFPHHAVNYESGRQLPDGTIRYNPSFLVEVPRAKGNGLYDSDPADARRPVAAQQPLRRGGGAGMTAPRDRVIGAADGYYPPRNGQ